MKVLIRLANFPLVSLQHVPLGFGEIRALHTQTKVKNRKILPKIRFLMSDTEMTTNFVVKNYYYLQTPQNRLKYTRNEKNFRYRNGLTFIGLYLLFAPRNVFLKFLGFP